jgi:hypothetical protein
MSYKKRLVVTYSSAVHDAAVVCLPFRLQGYMKMADFGFAKKIVIARTSAILVCASTSLLAWCYT